MSLGIDSGVQEVLARAAARPGHAYLLVGARGSGVEEASRELAAVLVAPGDARALDLARRSMHPDIVEFEPEGGTYRVDDVRKRIIPEASRSPVEGDRKVVVVLEADRLCAGRGESANTLLKTIEEPPPRTVMVLVTSFPDELFETVRSRCQRIDLVPPSEAEVVAALVAGGVPERDATRAARLAGGQLGRARRLAGPDAPVRDAFVAAVTTLDGHAGAAVRAAEAVAEALRASVADLEARQEREAAELAAELERSGYSDRAVSGLMGRLADRHRREHRAARRHALVEGITAIETLYRDALAGPGAPARNVDRPPLSLTPRAAVRALDVCRDARDALERNPNESLLLEWLFVRLPAASEGTG